MAELAKRQTTVVLFLVLALFLLPPTLLAAGLVGWLVYVGRSNRDPTPEEVAQLPTWRDAQLPEDVIHHSTAVLRARDGERSTKVWYHISGDWEISVGSDFIVYRTEAEALADSPVARGASPPILLLAHSPNVTPIPTALPHFAEQELLVASDPDVDAFSFRGRMGAVLVEWLVLGAEPDSAGEFEAWLERPTQALRAAHP